MPAKEIAMWLSLATLAELIAVSVMKGYFGG